MDVSVESLTALHRAHVERVPYTSLDIHLGRATTVDQFESADRVVGVGRAGYCFHNNGAFAALLQALGYDVCLHDAAVQSRLAPAPPGKISSHVALTVRGLPTEAAPDGEWLVEGPLTFGLVPSVVAPGGWRLEHDPLGAFTGVDMWPEPVDTSQFEAQHQDFSTSPASGFVRVLSVSRRTASGSEALRGCVLRTVGLERDVAEVELTDRRSWLDAVAHLGPSLEDVTPEEREALWVRVRSGHDSWVEAGRP